MSIIEKLQDPEVLATLPMGEKLSGALIVMVLGIATCIVILTILMFAVKLMHFIMSKSEAKAEKAVAPAGEIDPATAAAIVSAVSEMEGGKPFKVRSIKQVNQGGK